MSTDRDILSPALWSGAVAISPVLIGVIPFGLVTGIATNSVGLGLGEAVGMSIIVFAGASQLAALDLIGAGAPAWIAIMTAIVINLRMAMYSASLAVHLTDQTAGRRAIAAYLLTDQAYGMSIARYQRSARAGDIHGERPAADRYAFFLGAAVVMWISWQITTIIGFLVGSAVPEAIPLAFAVPLTFLCLMVRSVSDRPTLAAAVIGGSVALAGVDLPANLGMPLGAGSGVLIGYLLARKGAR